LHAYSDHSKDIKYLANQQELLCRKVLPHGGLGQKSWSKTRTEFENIEITEKLRKAGIFEKRNKQQEETISKG
jgi:hypothetical protein